MRMLKYLLLTVEVQHNWIASELGSSSSGTLRGGEPGPTNLMHRTAEISLQYILEFVSTICLINPTSDQTLVHSKYDIDGNH